MAFADGFSHEVTVLERTSGSTAWATLYTKVRCRIAPMKVADIQAISEVLSEKTSHQLTAELGAGIRAGHRLRVTKRRTGGAFEAAETVRDFLVVTCGEAEGGAAGAHHLRGYLSEMTGTG